MFKLLGIAYVDFIPEGEKTSMQGYKFHFSEEIDPDRGFGSIPFSYFVRAEKSAIYGLNSSADMKIYAPHIGKDIDLAFDRKGKLVGISLPAIQEYPPDTTKPDTSARLNKLGA